MDSIVGACQPAAMSGRVSTKPESSGSKPGCLSAMYCPSKCAAVPFHLKKIFRKTAELPVSYISQLLPRIPFFFKI